MPRIKKRKKRPEFWNEPEGGWSADDYELGEDGQPLVNWEGKPKKRRGFRKGHFRQNKPKAAKVEETKPAPESEAKPAPGPGPSIVDNTIAEMTEVRSHLPDSEPETFGSEPPVPEPTNPDDPSAPPAPQPVDAGPPIFGHDPTAPDPVAPAKDNNPLAIGIVGGFIGAGCVILGPEFAAENPQEKEGMIDATAEYLNSLDTDLSPGWAMVLSFGLFTASKFANESVRDMAVKRLGQIRRKKPEVKKPEQPAQPVTVAEGEVEKKPTYFESQGVKTANKKDANEGEPKFVKDGDAVSEVLNMGDGFGEE